MIQEKIFREQQNNVNIRVEVKGKELLVFNNFWSTQEPIIKLKNWEGLPKYFIDDEIDVQNSLFWETCQIREIDIRELYIDIKRDNGLRKIYKKRKGKRSFLKGII